MGKVASPVAGQTLGPVQDRVHLTGSISVVVPGDRDQCLGHSKCNM